MTYYRIAIHTKHTPAWRWMTTKLTSLHAVLAALQTYRCSPAYAQLRVFFASSVEALEDLLAVENLGDASFSVTREQLLSGGQMQAQREGLAVVSQQTRTTTAGITVSNTVGAQAMPLFAGGITPWEVRRVAMEQGTGGDHDQPYRFAFPQTLSETRAWLRLRAEAQSNERAT